MFRIYKFGKNHRQIINLSKMNKIILLDKEIRFSHNTQESFVGSFLFFGGGGGKEEIIHFDTEEAAKEEFNEIVKITNTK